MLASLQIRAVGPVEDLLVEFPDPMGWTEIRGPSEAGKTILLRAAVFALQGRHLTGEEFPVEEIRDGHDACVAAFETISGSVLVREMNRRRATKRTLRRADGAAQVYKNEPELQAALGPLGERQDLVRVIMAPFAWVPLLQEKLGRPLRDLVLSVLPPSDVRAVVAEMMEAAAVAHADAEKLTGEERKRAIQARGLRPGDPVEGKMLASVVKTANEAKAKAAGALGQAQAALKTAQERKAPDAPSQEDQETAKGIQAAARAWGEYDTAMKGQEGALALIAERQRQHDAWKAEVDALGQRPTFSAAELETAKGEQYRTQQAIAREEAARAPVATPTPTPTTTATAKRAFVCPVDGKPCDGRKA